MKLGARHRALALLAKGGMGSVWLGEEIGLAGEERKLVAIKTMHPHVAESTESVALFLDEARAGTRLDHPNVVRVFDADIGDDGPYLVMEYVEGVSWSRLIRRFAEEERVPPLPIIARVVHDVLLGLEAAHAAAIIHRDVSPQNILVGVDGRARLTDFGIATFAGRIAATMPGAVRGKVGYIAPEQISQARVDSRADLFSTGIVLWEAIAAEPLFQCERQADTLAKLLREPIRPLSTIVPDIAFELEDVCLKALERDPGRRFPTARAFADALASATELASPEDVAVAVCRLGATDLEEQRAAREAALRASVAATPQPRTRKVSEESTVVVTRPVHVVGRSSGLVVMIAAGGLLVLGTVIGRASSPASLPPPASAPAVFPDPPPLPLAPASPPPPVETASAEPASTFAPPPVASARPPAHRVLSSPPPPPRRHVPAPSSKTPDGRWVPNEL